MNIGQWIMSIFGDSLALLVYFSMFLAGMTVTIVKLLFGGDADHGDVGHGDVGHGDVHADHGDLHADHGEADAGGAPGLFSITGGVYLLTGYGGVAFIVMYFTEKVVVSALAGLAGGWPFAMLCLWMYKLFLSQQASSMVQGRDFVGAAGTVDTAIRENGLGEVVLLVAGRQITKAATTSGGGALPSGTPVRVTQYLGDRVIVERMQHPS